jgi:hypothetical protein
LTIGNSGSKFDAMRGERFKVTRKGLENHYDILPSKVNFSRVNQKLITLSSAVRVISENIRKKLPLNSGLVDLKDISFDEVLKWE